MSTFNEFPVATNGYVDTDGIHIDTDIINKREAKLKMASLYGKLVYNEIDSVHKEPEYQFNAEERAYFNFLVNNRKYSVNEAIKAVVEYKRRPVYMTLNNIHEFM